MFSKLFFENCVLYEIMWKNIVQLERPQMTIWCMHISRWVPKATNTHSEHVISYCFSISTIVAQKRLSFTLHVVCLS